MVARDGVEPPTPAFSGATGAVLTVTYRNVEGCKTPVRTRKASEKRARTTGWRLEDDLRTLIALDFDSEIRKLLTEEAPLAALCAVSAGSERAEIAQYRNNSRGIGHSAKPVLTSSDGQIPSQKLSVGGKQGNTSDPASNGENTEICEYPTPHRLSPPLGNQGSQDDREEPDSTGQTLQPETAIVLLPNRVDGNKPDELSAKFTESIRDLMRGAPKRFKELYPMSAERQPEDCRVDGNKVCLGSMEWLHEIERELYDVAVNRDGLWHLKEAAAARYDREELYEKV